MSDSIRILLLNRIGFRAGSGGLLALLLFGTVFWAKARDPFQRIWFNVKVERHAKAEGLALLPKMASGPLPVVVYLHDSDRSLIASGNDLQQMAEMGIAVVGMECGQMNETTFEAQFIALQGYLRRQDWADVNAIAWVGFGLGAQRQLSFALQHPEHQPKLLLGVASGWIPKLDNLGLPTQHSTFFSKVLLLHGEQDSRFPLSEAQQVAAVLRTNGCSVRLDTFPGQTHTFDPNRGVLFRGIGEYALTFFKGEHALDAYQSILAWQMKSKPLLLFWLPALLWIVPWYYCRRQTKSANHDFTASEAPARHEHPMELSRAESSLRLLAGLLAVLIFGQMALHLVTPQLEITARTLEIARHHLLQPEAIPDFDSQSTNSLWKGKKLRTLLTHVELASLSRQRVNWKLDDEVYQKYVLNAQVEAARDGAMDWRRPLWESFFPRIRKENNPAAAAEILVRHLRMRVTVVRDNRPTTAIRETWARQLADLSGFEALYVATMRSAGVPARLSGEKQVEFFTGNEWRPAPRPMFINLITRSPFTSTSLETGG